MTLLIAIVLALIFMPTPAEALPIVMAAAGAAISMAVAGSFSWITLAVAVLSAGLKMAMSGKQKSPEFTPFTQTASDRTHMVRSSIQAHRWIYGTAKVSGPMVAAFSSEAKLMLHLVLPLAGHQVARFQEIFLNDTLSTDARFMIGSPVPFLAHRLKTIAGTCGQAADSDLVAEVPDWTSAHRLRGLAYLYAKLRVSTEAFPTGIPNLAVVVDGRMVYDPRIAGVTLLTSIAASPAVFTTSGAHGFAVGDRVWLRDHAGAVPVLPASYDGPAPAIAKEFEVASVPTSSTLTLCDPYRRSDAYGDDNFVALATGGTGGTLTRMRWTNNAALCIADYHWAPVGGDCDIDEVDEAVLIESANVCDEYVTVTSVVASGFVADPATDVISMGSHYWETGDRVQVSTTGTLPGGLAAATNYYWIRLTQATGHLATSLADARSFTAINLTTAGTGANTITKSAHLRYTMNGTFDLDMLPPGVVEDMLTAMAGARPYSQGSYKIIAGAYASPTRTITIDHLAGDIDVEPFLKRAQLYNAVRGTFVDPSQLWVPTEFPLLTNGIYEGQDGGERIYRDIELPYTTDSTRAQRLAMIALLKSRQAVTATLPCNWSALDIGLWETINVSIAQLGWSAKVFRVTDIAYPDEGGVTLTVQEEASTSYSWSAGDATAYDPAPNTNLPNPFEVEPPGPPSITETMYDTRDGGGVKVMANLSWAASDDAFVGSYRPEYKASADTVWTALPATTETSASALDLAPGLYDFRVTAVNTLGVRSEPDDATTSNHEIVGLMAPPSAPSVMTISAAGGLAIIRFAPSPDLDVRQGGHGEMRHSPAVSGALWSESTSIGDEIPGSETVVLVPLLAGSYLMKWRDSSGVLSDAFASVVTKQATALPYTDLMTLAEHSTFSGTHSSTSADDGALKLGGGSLIDTWASVDAVANWDSEGGVAASGTYSFSTNYDHGSVAPLRFTANLAVEIFNPLDLIDSRPGMIDDWEDFDGTGDAGPADAQLWCRETDDDPAGAPVWGAWQRLDSAELEARAVQFQARLFSYDAAYNVRVPTCGVTIAEVT